jgi:hypothetical protein
MSKIDDVLNQVPHYKSSNITNRRVVNTVKVTNNSAAQYAQALALMSRPLISQPPLRKLPVANKTANILGTDNLKSYNFYFYTSLAYIFMGALGGSILSVYAIGHRYIVSASGGLLTCMAILLFIGANSKLNEVAERDRKRGILHI